MNNSQNSSEKVANDRINITLMNGQELSCILKSDQPKEVISDEIKLDTTGRYLSLKNKPDNFTESDMDKAKHQYNHHIFTENAWFFLDNAEKIFSDSRMFLAPVRIVNGLAYTGTSGFQHPTLGVYLEWWLNHKEAAVDANGNLVWFISGSPLSGSNCCSSVTPEGKQVKIAQRTSFTSIWRSFIDVNNRYTEAKQRCEVYSLEEVLLKLRGDGYLLRMNSLKHEMIQMVMGWNYDRLEQCYDKLKKRLTRVYRENRKLQFHQHKQEITEFGKEYFEKEKAMNAVHEVFLKEHKILKEKLHSKELSEAEYKSKLSEAKKDYRVLKSELSDFANSFMHKTFGKNPNEITLQDVLKSAKDRLKNQPSLPAV